jgi:hypothetical protein
VKFDTLAAAAVVAAAAKTRKIAQSESMFYAGKINWKRHIDKHQDIYYTYTKQLSISVTTTLDILPRDTPRTYLKGKTCRCKSIDGLGTSLSYMHVSIFIPFKQFSHLVQFNKS